MGENKLFTKTMWLTFSMVDVILNQITYFSKKTHTLFRGLKLRCTYITTKNLQKNTPKIDRTIHFKTTK